MGAKSGRCLCRAVQFTAVSKAQDDGSVHVDACRCSMRRRQTGGPLMGVMLDGAPVIEGETRLAVYESSGRAARLFCKNCGSNLFYRLKDDRIWTALAGALDDLSDAKFAVESFIDEKPAYNDFSHPVRKMTGAQVFAAFAGGDEG